MNSDENCLFLRTPSQKTGRMSHQNYFVNAIDLIKKNERVIFDAKLAHQKNVENSGI